MGWSKRITIREKKYLNCEFYNFNLQLQFKFPIIQKLMNSLKDSCNYLSDEQRGYIYSLHEQGFSYYSIKKEFFSENQKKIYGQGKGNR